MPEEKVNWVLARWKLFSLQKINREDNIFLHNTIVFSCPWNDWQPALSFRDAQTIFNVKFNVECASILRTTPVPKSFEYYYQPQKTEGARSTWQDKVQMKTFFTVKEVCLLSAIWEYFVCFFFSLCLPSPPPSPATLSFFLLSYLFIFRLSGQETPLLCEQVVPYLLFSFSHSDTR